MQHAAHTMKHAAHTMQHAAHTMQHAAHKMQHAARKADATQVLHAHGALAAWDYASAGPYVRVDMNPATRPMG